MPNEKIYVGRAKYIDTQYGEICKIWLTPEGVDAINANVDNNGGINLVMNEMRNPDRAGFTHVLTVDDWKPGQSSTRRHGPQRRDPDGDPRRYAGRDRGRDDNRGYSRRDDGGFGSYADPGQGNGGHRYGEADRNPPDYANQNGRDGRDGRDGQRGNQTGGAGGYDAPPNAKDVSPAGFDQRDIARGLQTDPDDFSGIVDDDIPF